MLRLRDVSISVKLTASFLCILGLTIILGFTSYMLLKVIDSSSAEMAKVWTPAMEVTTDMLQSANDFRRAEFRHILSTSAAERQQAEARMAAARKVMDDSVAKLRSLTLNEECATLLRNFATAWQAFLPVNTKLVGLSTDNLGRDATLLLQSESSKLFNDAITLLSTLSDKATQRGKATSETIASSVSTGIARTALIATVIVLVGAAVTLILPRVITRRIRETQILAEEVARGKLDACIEVDSRDEVGRLQKAFMDMLCKLKEELAFSQGVLRGLTVPCSVFSAEDKTLFTNQLMLDLIERDGSPQDYLGQTSGGYIWGDSARETLSTKALRENRSLTVEMPFTTHKSTKRHARVTSSPFFDQSGNTLGTLSVWIDLTDIKQQEALIAAQSQQILEVASRAEEVSEAVSSASEQLSAQVDQAKSGAGVQRDRAAETATAMEEMNSTVLEVAQNAQSAASRSDSARLKAQDGMAVVTAMVDSINAVRSQAETLRDRMSSLEERALNIGRILNVISDIADQTNLLALNAAIEAARAGEAGRGFAVVADEVRKLAEKTMAATHEVAEAITGIQREAKENMANVERTASAIDGVTGLARQSGDALDEIVRLSDSATLEVHAIATASEEQSQASNEINRAVAEINTISSETAQAMAHAAEAVTDLARQAATLQQLIASMRGGGQAQLAA